MVIITESCMQFGEYPEDKVFHIEASTQYTSYLKIHGIKSCEFILARENNLLFVEAKTSNPKYPTEETSEEKILLL